MTFSKKTTPLHSTPLHSTPLHSTHSTELFKIFFSLLTLSTAFLQKASGPGKNLSRITLDIENQILKIMINYFISKNVNILTLEYDELKIFTDKNIKRFSINELELSIYKQLGINIKLAFKNIEDSFSEFGIRVSTDNIKNKNIIENEIKIIHHDHSLERNNILGYICRECNL